MLENKDKISLNFEMSMTIIGIFFFGCVALSDWSNADYSQINDHNMDCETILKDFDRLGITGYILDGKANVPDSYYNQEPNLERKRIEEEQQRLEQQRLEQQRLEQQRLEQQRLEQQRREQQRWEQQRRELAALDGRYKRW